MNLAEKYHNIQQQVPSSVQLIAVSKTKPQEDIRELYQLGQRDFGENKIQEMCDKSAVLPSDIRWHMIGHVQTNKVKYMIDFVHLIHGVDSLKLLKEINKRAQNIDKIQNVLLQLKVAEEDSKFGMSFADAQEILSQEIDKLQNVKIIGIMGMATFTDNRKQIQDEFNTLKNYFDQLKVISPNLQEISMGMSSDFPLAIAEGSTMIRVGSSIFGHRN